MVCHDININGESDLPSLVIDGCNCLAELGSTRLTSLVVGPPDFIFFVFCFVAHVIGPLIRVHVTRMYVFRGMLGGDNCILMNRPKGPLHHAR